MLACCAGAACSRAQGTGADGGSGEVGETGAAAPPATARASSSAVPATGRATAAWRGTYKSVAAAPEWKAHVKGPESTAGLGEGTLTLSVDAGGRVSGAIDGPLGPATIDGLAADRALTATIARKDPSDRGFTGTLSGTIEDAKATGTMNVTLGEASVVRTVTFSLSPAETGTAR
jgi:hypothetical protein